MIKILNFLQRSISNQTLHYIILPFWCFKAFSKYLPIMLLGPHNRWTQSTSREEFSLFEALLKRTNIRNHWHNEQPIVHQKSVSLSTDLQTISLCRHINTPCLCFSEQSSNSKDSTNLRYVFQVYLPYTLCISIIHLQSKHFYLQWKQEYKVSWIKLKHIA